MFATNETETQGKRKSLVSFSHTLTACATDSANVISQLNVKKTVNSFVFNNPLILKRIVLF